MKRCILTALIVLMVLASATIFASASDPEVSIISPTQTVSGNNLLISVRVTAPITIKVYAYEEKQKIGDTYVSIDPAIASDKDLSNITIKSISLMTPETVDVTGNLHFYSKKLENLNPGLYRIKVETLNSDGEVVSYTNVRTVMMPKSLDTTSGKAIFQTQNQGALQWVQNLLKSIFRN